jgi:hypothetical protein
MRASSGNESVASEKTAETLPREWLLAYLATPPSSMHPRRRSPSDRLVAFAVETGSRLLTHVEMFERRKAIYHEQFQECSARVSL